MLPWVAFGAEPTLEPCGTPERLMDRLRSPLPIGAPAPSDPYDLPNERASEHFVVRWGSAGGVSEPEVEPLLEAFERAWQEVIDRMDHPPPVSPFPVYLGDTGGPASLGASGYYTADDQGRPMIVVARRSLEIGPEHAAHTAQHEFYHAVQDATGRFGYDGPSAWYWEATAEWAAIEIDPENPYNGPFVYAYLLLPELPVDLFDRPGSRDLREYRPYGAFLFPRALTDRLGYALVRDSWAEPGPGDDPLEVMRAWLADRGEDLDQQWLDHLARNAVFDHPLGELYRTNVEIHAPRWPGASRVTAEVSGSGGEGEVRGPGIHRYGAANLLLSDPEPGILEIRLSGAASGSLGSPARYGARAVLLRDGIPTYREIRFEGARGALDLEVGAEEEIWVTVGAWTPERDRRRWTDEIFPLSWSLRVDPTDPLPGPEAPAPPPPGGCGCGGGAEAGGGVTGIWLLAAATRRRGRVQWR